MSKSERTVEQSLRRLARRAGLLVRKSRRAISADNLGGYKLVDANNWVVAGAQYDLTAQDVIDFCSA